MFAAESNSSNRLLTMRFWGHVDADQMRRCSGQVKELLIHFQPGFQVLTDLTNLDVMEHNCVPFIKELMEQCDNHGVSAVVRIIPDAHKDIGFNLMTLFHYKPTVHITICQSREEADKRLGN